MKYFNPINDLKERLFKNKFGPKAQDLNFIENKYKLFNKVCCFEAQRQIN